MLFSGFSTFFFGFSCRYAWDGRPHSSGIWIRIHTCSSLAQYVPKTGKLLIHILFFMCYYPHDFHPTPPERAYRYSFYERTNFEKIFWCCFSSSGPGSAFLNAVLQIRDIYPADQNCFIPDPDFFYTESRIPKQSPRLSNLSNLF
jgi:hypothetical protein